MILYSWTYIKSNEIRIKLFEGYKSYGAEDWMFPVSSYKLAISQFELST